MTKLVSALILLSLSVLPAEALEQAIPIFTESNEENILDIDHSLWQEFLSQTVISPHPSGINRIDYSSVSPQQLSLLTSYIEQMASVDPRLYSRNAQFAFWVNLYNALTIDLILENYPIESIRDIKSGFFSFGPWGKKIHRSVNIELSLDDIEHKILRPIWQDPRIHYAVNCASVGCPNIQADAFTADNTIKLLNSAAGQYINHPRGVSVKNDELEISSIYHWYIEDFGGDVNEIVKHLLVYAEPRLSRLLNRSFYRYDHTYDWKLNRP